MNPNLPDYIRREALPSLGATLLKTLGSAAPPRVSISGNRFHLNTSDGVTTPIQTFHMDIVIAQALPYYSRQWRETDGYDPDSPTGPDCFSDNGIGASDRAMKPQSTSCSTCRWAERGSAISKVSGKPVAACRQQQTLCVLVKDHDGVYQFVIPPGSLAPFRGYLTKISQHGYEPFHLITRVEFVSGQTGVMSFKSVSDIPEDMFQKTAKLIKSDLGMQIMNGHDKVWSGGPRLVTRESNPELTQQLEASIAASDDAGVAAAMKDQPKPKKSKPKAEELFFQEQTNVVQMAPAEEVDTGDFLDKLLGKNLKL